MEICRTGMGCDEMDFGYGGNVARFNWKAGIFWELSKGKLLAWN